MTDRLITRMLKWKIINEDEIEIYRFGLETLFLKMFHYISYLLIAIFCGGLVTYAIFFMAFLCLRKNAGGYHSKTKLSCYFWSCLTVISVIFIVKYVMAYGIPSIMSIGSLVVADIIIFMLAPVGNCNRGLDIDEIDLFRKRTIWVLTLENMLVLLLFAVDKIQFSLPLILAIVCQAILLLLQKSINE